MSSCLRSNVFLLKDLVLPMYVSQGAATTAYTGCRKQRLTWEGQVVEHMAPPLLLDNVCKRPVS